MSEYTQKRGKYPQQIRKVKRNQVICVPLQGYRISYLLKVKKMKHISAIILACIFGIQAFAQAAPTINPLGTFWGENGEEQSNNYSGSAPLRARFEANAEYTDGWMAYYEWHFYMQGKQQSPYLIRYEKDTEYTFRAGNGYNPLYTGVLGVSRTHPCSNFRKQT